MAGHSHWAGIKHKKAIIDARRGKLWSKLARMIIVAARQGGGDPEMNLALRYAIEKARAANMPKDTIEKAVKRGTGGLEGASYEEVVYEGYGPGGVAIMVEVLTDNRSRTAPEMKKVFERHGGSMGASGCVSWMFSKRGLITVSTSAVDEDRLLELALSAGAEDMKASGDVYEITCEPAQFSSLRKSLEDAGVPLNVAEIAMVPKTSVSVTDPSVAKKVIELMEAIEDHDDVQNAYSNFDIPADILAKASSQ